MLGLNLLLLSWQLIPVSGLPSESSAVNDAPAQSIKVAEESQEHSFLPQPAMLPTVHWDTLTDSLDSLMPSNTSSLYFTPSGQEDGFGGHDFAHVRTNNTHEAVILAHSSHVSSVTCNKKENTIAIHCPNDEAFEYTATHWPTKLPFAAATLHGDCGSSLAQHSFFLITSVDFDADQDTINLTYSEELDIASVFEEVEVSWGQYLPSKAKLAKRAETTGAVVAVASPASAVPGPAASVAPSGVPAAPAGPIDTTCGPAPASTVDGLPAVACGLPNFDKALDAAAGFLSFTKDDYSASLKLFAPGLGDFGATDNSDFGPVVPKTKRSISLQKRSFADNVAKKLKKVTKKVIKKAGQAIGKFAGAITVAVSDALSVTPMASATISVSLTPKNDAPDSPFGPAKLLFNRTKMAAGDKLTASVNVYCVSCGVEGQLQLYGLARYSLSKGLTAANAGITGNITAGLQIGLDAQAAYAQQFRKSILSLAAPPGFSVPKIFVIGPILSLDVEAEVTASGSLQLLTGASVSIPNFAADLDLVNNGKTMASFQPVFERIFSVNGSVQAEAALGLPLGIALGIEIPAINFKKTAGVYNKPYAGGLVVATGSNLAPDANCGNSISYNFKVGNQIYADIFGTFTKQLLDKPLASASQCYRIGSPARNPANPKARRSLLTLAERDTDILSDVGVPVSKPNDQFPFEFITDNPPDSPLSVPNFANLSIQAIAFADLINVAGSSGATNASSGAFGLTTEDPDASLVSIKDLTGMYTFAADALSGNVFLLNSTNNVNATYFTQTGPGQPVLADASGIDFAHYYPDTMAKYGVSRLRFTNYTVTAKNADLIGFVPTSTNDDPTAPLVYAAYDTLEVGPFLPVTCEYVDPKIPAKVFLANATTIDLGLKKLLEPSLRYTVTGNVVKECFYVPMKVE